MSFSTTAGEFRHRQPDPIGRTLARVSPVVLALCTLTVLAAALRFVGLGHQGFWFDEANTAADVHFSPGKMLGLLPQNETTPPLFYCVAWVWARVFGFGEAALRALPALAGVATVPVAYAAGRKLVSPRAGLVAAGLTACSPFLIWYSQEFRPYELLVLLSGAGLAAFAYAREQPTPRAVRAWAILSALAIADHYYAFLAVVPEAVWLLALTPRLRRVQLAVAVVGLCGLALLPLALSQNSTGNASWIAPIPLGPRLGQIVPDFLVGFQMPAEAVFLTLAKLIAVFALVLVAVRADAAERRGAVVAGTIAVAGLALNLVLVAGGIDDLITRNLLALWLPAALVVAAGLGARRAGWAGLAGAAALCAIGVVATIGVDTTRSLQRPDWRAVARLLGRVPAAGVGARAIFIQHYKYLLPLSLSMPGLHFVRAATVRVRELDVVSFTAPRVPLCWYGAACNLSGTRTQPYAVTGFREVSEHHEYQFTVQRYEAAQPIAVDRGVIEPLLRTTAYRHDELIVQRP
jgi:hypothetical protein